MPTTRHRRQRNRLSRNGLTEGAYEFFAHGPYFPEAQEFERETTEAERSALWTRHKAEIMPRYMEALRQRGRWFAGWRPDYFWRELEAQGHERQKIGTDSYWPPWGTHGPGPAKHETEYDLFENNFQFLDRLGLLEPWELEAGDPDQGKGTFD